MAIIEADRVGGYLKNAVWWFKTWEQNERRFPFLVEESSDDRDSVLRYLDLAILELRRLDERGPLGLRNPALERLIPSRLDDSSLTRQGIVSRLT